MSRRRDLFDHLGSIIESRPVRWLLVVLVLFSLPPFSFEEELRELFLIVFGAELVIRVSLMRRDPGRRRRDDYGFFVVDLLAFLSFLPLEEWTGLDATVLNFFRLTRLFVLLRFARELAKDVYSILTRREQLQQFGLVTATVVTLAFGSAVILSQLGISHNYTGNQESPSGFWDRVWWSFRQLESADNLVENLQVQPLVAVVSLGLTIVGVFIISFIIGLGSNIVGQVFRAERRRPVGYRRHSLVLGPVDGAEILIREFVRLYDKNRSLRRFHLGEVWEWLFHRGPAPRRHALARMALLGPGSEPPAYLLEPEMRWVVYREGEGADRDALTRVGADAVKRAILLAHHEAGHDADAITVASLSAFRANNRGAHVFVEVLDSDNVDLVRGVGGEGTFPLDVPRFMGLFLCHHLLIPGADSLFRELLTAEGCEFYTHLYVDPREREALSQLAEDQPALTFDALARYAFLEHGVILAGVFLGEGDLSRTDAELIPVDRLVQWVNPAVLVDDDPIADRLDAKPGAIPTEHLRGVIGLSSSYMPLRRFARRLLRDRPTETRPPEASAEAVVERVLVPEKPIHRVLVVGYSLALPSLLSGLARFVPQIEVVLVLGCRDDSERMLRSRLATLSLPIPDGPLPGADGCRCALERDGSVTIYTHDGPDLTRFSVDRLAEHGPADAAVFLSDPDSVDRDARTQLRLLRFARALARDEVPRGDHLHILAELMSVTRGPELERHVDAKRCGFDAGALRLTLVSTDQVKNYFMVHSAFVPGVTALYDKLLGARGMELVRLPVEPRDRTGAPEGSGEVAFVDLMEALAPRGVIPIAVELDDGQVVINPAPSERFNAAQVRALFGIADSDRTPEEFRQPWPRSSLDYIIYFAKSDCRRFKKVPSRYGGRHDRAGNDEPTRAGPAA